jgi:hypothetical protein
MSDLRVTTDEVRELGDKLRFVATEFENAEDIAEDYGEMVSHSGLADELESFADNWDAHRAKLMENLKSFYETAKQAADAYDEVEQELIKALEGN